MLLVTSFVGSILGFLVCHRTIMKMNHSHNAKDMRVCMLNSMSLAFIFAMFIELTTSSKTWAIIIPIATICLPMVIMMKTFTILDLVESGIAMLMSASMSIMLIGMVSPIVIWVIQCILLFIEIMLYSIVVRDIHQSQRDQ